jgi:hypothetical protein
MNKKNCLVLGCMLALASVAVGATGSSDSSDGNLLPNGDFSDVNQIAGWTNLGGGAMVFSSTVDANGEHNSGSILLTTDGLGDQTYAVSSCFQTLPGAVYSYGGFVGKSKQAAQSLGTFTCSAYSTKNCIGTHFELPSAFTTGNNVSGSGALPVTAGSVNCEISARTAPANGGITHQSDAYFDNLFFNSAAPVASGITLDGYMSGNWYDAAEGGQGFQLEFTDQGSLLAIWFVYTPDGSGQNWIYAQGSYDATRNTATVPAEILTGARFPPLFKSSDVHTTPWGTMTFTFTDCDHGTASWSSTVPGYGSGSMPISRLTRISGTTCSQ